MLNHLWNHMISFWYWVLSYPGISTAGQDLCYNASPTDNITPWLFVRNLPLKLFVMPMV